MIGKRSEPAKAVSENQHIDTLIGAHSSFKGELAFEGAVRIDGRFEGNIRSVKEGTLIVSQGAEITGEIHVPNLILYGTVKGNVHATRSLRLGETGCINGDVEYRVITLAEGAAVNGRCLRISDKPQQQAAAPQQKQPAQQGETSPNAA